ncbi:hypothetical protein VVMO6_04528 [Vibrio vulnificus MO6-24/O]|nr:hypothetical protein VVMO6_04528 [Vibrio vulnificus MO6-24/O]
MSGLASEAHTIAANLLISQDTMVHKIVKQFTTCSGERNESR